MAHSKGLRRAMSILPWVFACSSLSYAKTWNIPAGPHVEQETQEALILAEPGDTVVLPAGRFAMSVELSMTKPQVTLKGQGMEKTQLIYTDTAEGAQGIISSANDTVVEDLSVINHPGDGIKAVGVDGFTLRRVRVEWTKRGAAENGAYGLYPVQCSNVLIEDSVVIGASDAGIYVGQSKNIVVRRNRVEYNVAGIEIENSQKADVYSNYATNNTGGILVFNLPNLLVQGGRGTRLYQNTIVRNNFKNFAPPGNSVALTPQGTGILIMGNDEIEIFENEIADHNTTSIAVVSYHITERPVEDPNYDAQPEAIYIHDNVMRNSGRWPVKGGNKLGLIAAALSLPHPIPHITYDGLGQIDNEGKIQPAKAQGDRRICIGKNDADGGDKAYFGNMNLWKQRKWLPIPGEMNRDLTPHDCSLTALAEVTLKAPPTLIVEKDPAIDPVNIETLCKTDGLGVNWPAYAADCPDLADYRLFRNPDDPLGELEEGGYPYEPTTPLFSDYASKRRAIFLPPGASMDYQASDTFSMPVGTIIAKSFYFPADLRQPDGPRRLMETRLLIHRESGWKGLEYIWSEDGRQARLKRGGGVAPVQWKNAKGESLSNNYRMPNTAQCVNCHLKGTPIGVKAGYLNREGIGALKGQNQLVYLANEGRLEGLPARFEEIPRFPVWNKPETGSLEARARTYLDINCAHCHSISGKASTSALFLNLAQPAGINAGYCKPPIAAGRGAGGVLFDIFPGSPEKSILINRMGSTKAAIKMPETAKNMVHDEGVALVSEWIKSLPGTCKE